jgi:hypothetical protein
MKPQSNPPPPSASEFEPAPIEVEIEIACGGAGQRWAGGVRVSLPLHARLLAFCLETGIEGGEAEAKALAVIAARYLSLHPAGDQAS